MRKARFVLMFALLVLLLSVSPSMTLAQEPLPGLDGPVSNWTDTDLRRLVELIVSERITVSQSEVIAEQMTEEQVARVGELLAVKAGIPLDEWRQSIESNQTDSQSPKMTLHGSTPLYRGEIWRQYIEYYSNLGYSPKPWYYSTSTECGGDDDWVYVFLVYYAQDPDGLRWWTDSSRVYWAFLIAYNLKLNGFSYQWTEARLCVGKSAASAAGGASYVKNHLYCKHK